MSNTVEEVVVYGALCPEGQERALAYDLLKRAVEEHLGLPDLPEIRRQEKGKPLFPDYPDFHFNLSHSHGAAVCAVHCRPVGVDVEKLRPAPKRLAAGMTDEAFFRLWTAREAGIKRAGEGWTSLLKDEKPDENSRELSHFLPGWIVTVCPTEEAAVRCIVVK